jgi:hypothetical protein
LAARAVSQLFCFAFTSLLAAALPSPVTE